MPRLKFNWRSVRDRDLIHKCSSYIAHVSMFKCDSSSCAHTYTCTRTCSYLLVGLSFTLCSMPTHIPMLLLTATYFQAREVPPLLWHRRGSSGPYYGARGACNYNYTEYCSLHMLMNVYSHTDTMAADNIAAKGMCILTLVYLH